MEIEKNRKRVSVFFVLSLTVVSSFGLSADDSESMLRARDLGIPFVGTPGPFNAITDVAGVEVGHKTLISGSGELKVGEGPVRTGVTAIMPRGKIYDPVFAAWYSLNGNGEMTGTAWVEESGFLETPILLTNTHSVGIVRDAVVEWSRQNKFFNPLPDAPEVFWSLPVVAETFDGILNDINGYHVRKQHVFSALDTASSGTVQEGSVGGGTGMICHAFKCGIGTASRFIETASGSYTVGVLVQANYGVRSELTIAGVPVGYEIVDLLPKNPAARLGNGSIVIVVATDAPLLPHQLKRLARRVPMGIARVGGYASNGSGDLFLAFSTANQGAASRRQKQSLEMLPNDHMNPLLLAVVQSTEEAIVNALVAGRDMVGVNGLKVYGIPHRRLKETLKKYNRL